MFLAVQIAVQERRRLVRSDVRDSPSSGFLKLRFLKPIEGA
jgi:hypothetical protein